jgi:hypothetical protein
MADCPFLPKPIDAPFCHAKLLVLAIDQLNAIM